MADDHRRSAKKFFKDMTRLSGLGRSSYGLGDGRVRDYRPVKARYRGGVQPRRKAG